MRYLALTLAAALSVALAGWPALAAAQNDRDYVFTDDQGHLVLRYAGAAPGGLTDSQMDEITNVQLSTMVHDRLRADALFDAEPVDPAWAKPMQARLMEALGAALPEMTALQVECRSAACRLLLEHSGGHTVAEHESLMDTAQRAVRAFLDAHPGQFEQVFLMAGLYKEAPGAYIKVFLRRARQPPSSGGSE
jgi:hypothetical protein